MTKKTVLMCPPDHFDIAYEINAWMHTDNQVEHSLAVQQWQKLYGIYTEDLQWDVKLMAAAEGLPDLVFTANGGLVISGQVALPHFRQPERQGETELDEIWFKQNGFTEFFLPKHDFEGEGDALPWNDILFAGYPWRTDKPAHAELADFFGIKVISLQLTSANFYHLDTALSIIDAETVAIFPEAFTDESIAAIHNIVPRVIHASHDDGYAYGLNAMSDGHNIVLSDKATGLINTYREMGYNPIGTPISEYQKSGGGVKCLTLEIRY